MNQRVQKEFFMVQKFETKTKNRLVVDVVVPGYGSDMVTVRKRTVNDGKTVQVVVAGKYARPHGETDKLVPRFGYDKVIDNKFEHVITVDTDYDVDGLKWQLNNGVIRVTLPKTAAAIGAAVAPIAADDNVNVVTGPEDAADDDE